MTARENSPELERQIVAFEKGRGIPEDRKTREEITRTLISMRGIIRQSPHLNPLYNALVRWRRIMHRRHKLSPSGYQDLVLRHYAEILDERGEVY